MGGMFHRFRRDETGAQLVEFALVLPMMLLVFAVIIEGGRLMWSYQAVAAGVRDATRYLARVAPRDICSSGGSVAGYEAALTGIVRNSASGEALFPSGILVNSVTPSLECYTGSYRSSEAPVVGVTAALRVTFPFAGLVSFAGGGTLGTIDTSVSDQARVYGS